ncbi:hypothetical protein R3P38DRAFT_2492098 [Favolaschia claudopus]|uniref:ABC transporter domain-containing protein n=1 Tax=Favolaschia claudopus TaxID=2862362 RepID=A0AAW0EFJ0_9AGAR
MALFWRQFVALFWKNWIVLSKHPFLNFLRCFLFPVAYGVFLAVAKRFLIKPNNYGIGDPVQIHSLQQQFQRAGTLVWADATDGTSQPSPTDIMARITSGFSASQHSAVRQVPTAAQLPFECPQNFNGFSECYAGLVFYDIPANVTSPVNYTILADSGLFHIDVVRHTSDLETRVLPLQWAVDQAIIELRTGVTFPTPFEWPFTNETNEEQDRRTRLSFIRGIRELLVIAFFICYIGIAYQLPGAVAVERASQVTAHMKAMGLLDSARIASWHISYSLIYLPAWIIVSLVWRSQIWVETNVLLILVVHILFGLTLASWSFFIAAPFGKSPQLAAVASTFLSILFAIIALILQHGRVGTGGGFVFTIIFPPAFYVFANRAMDGYENHGFATDALKADPDRNMQLLAILIAGLIDVFLWPYLACLLERRLYDAREPASFSKSWKCWGRRHKHEALNIPPDVAVSIQGLGKTFNTSMLNRKDRNVTAVSDLTLDIPRSGIFVLLGSNGAGKSTTLSVLGGLTGRSRGDVVFEGGIRKPPRGTIGIVPQKNVLIPELTCMQSLRVWRAVKWSKNSTADEDLEQLLRDCDLHTKIRANASTLSGGQKRKLQLAIGLVGGSKIVLVDECTSGVDPLSRRALWRTLIGVRNDRTIVFTSHFLDEADLLADNIAILAAPGKLVASGSPVALKRDLGEGYTVQVSLPLTSSSEKTEPPNDLLHRIRSIAPHAHMSLASPHQPLFHLKSKDPVVVDQVLQMLEQESEKYHVVSYDVLGTSIEEIFLDLMRKEESNENRDSADGLGEAEKSVTQSSASVDEAKPMALNLATGRATSPFQQALTIFYKRALIVRRSWLPPFLAVIIAIAGSTIPLIFISGRPQSCVKTLDLPATFFPLFPPISPIFALLDVPPTVMESPPGLLNNFVNLAALSGLANVTNSTIPGGGDLSNITGLLPFSATDVADNATFVQTILQNFLTIPTGGLSFDAASGNMLMAWEASAPGFLSLTMLNLADNVLLNHALNSSGRASPVPSLILPLYQSFPPVDAGTLVTLKWIAFFCAVMAVYPAFFALYVSKERRSSVQAMQFSNGLHNPVGMWLGHLAFDSIFTVIMATIVIIVFAAASNQFHGLGFFWLVIVLYGIAGALFAYMVSLIVSSPLAAFAAVAGYQIIMFVLYIAGYLLTLTYAKTSDADRLITIIHFTLSILSPVASVTRAGLVSVNLFSLLCNGDTTAISSSWMGSIMRYGGPIVYLIVYSLVLLAVLVWVDSGSLLPRKFRKGNKVSAAGADKPVKEDVALEAQSAAESTDPLRVMHITKRFGSNTVVDNVSFGASPDTIFCLLGPNGAGKTTTFNVIRGDVIPELGDVLIEGTSVVTHPRTARASLGVCPQFSAIDSQLTVREHLIVYGRLKGLRSVDLKSSVESLMLATGLHLYADRLASKLSGGNQRKLSLAIALMGNPSVVLIDEFSTGIDAKKKREMWRTLRAVAVGKVFVITTHAMEEASALANKVGILAVQLLAIGTTESLSARYATYEVHFACRSREDVTRAQTLMSSIPGARMADDVATRFEVPIEKNNGLSLAKLFHLLSTQQDFSEYTVERASLESVFLKVIRENNVQEEGHETRRRRWWLPFRR